MTETQEYKKYEKMIYNLAISYSYNGDKMDYLDLAFIGYTKAIKNFDYKKGIKKSTYIYKCIENELRNDYRKSNYGKRKGYNVDLDEIINEKEIVNSDKDDLIDDIIRTENNVKLYIAINKLDERKQIIIKNLFKINNNNKCIKELEEELGISKQRIYILRNEALKEMREYLK